jgi:hypothetical protein
MLKVKKIIAALITAMAIFSTMSISASAAEWGPLRFIPGSPSPGTIVAKSGSYTYSGYYIDIPPVTSCALVTCTSFSPSPNTTNVSANVICNASSGTAAFYSANSTSILPFDSLYPIGTKIDFYSYLSNYSGQYVEANGSIN